MRYAAIALAVGLALSAEAHAQVTIQKPWVRSTVPGQKVAGGFMTIASPSAVSLVGGSSPAARALEIHQTVMEGDVMRMIPVPRLEIPGGKPVELKPGSYHVMLIDIAKPLARGESVPIKLTFEQLGKAPETVEIKAEVRDVMGGGHRAAH